MLVYAGIDEAGYGPLLGPLCVGCAAFTLNDCDAKEGAPDLWKLLRRTICRAGSAGKTKRIAIDDSKKLKGPNDAKRHPLHHLERGVLTFLSLGNALCSGGAEPAGEALPPPSAVRTDSDLFALLRAAVPPQLWYGACSPVPTAHAADCLRIDSDRLLRSARAVGVSAVTLTCEVVDAADLNAQVERVGSKAVVNFGAAMRLLDRVWRTCPDAHPRIIIDRHGGRTHYRDPLSMMYPDAVVDVISESDSMSRYRITRGRSQATVTFLVEAESAHLPVALASMTAKYVRELLMARLNRFFTSHMPELKPTAGYLHDARRYVDEIRSLLAELQILPADFIRSV